MYRPDLSEWSLEAGKTGFAEPNGEHPTSPDLSSSAVYLAVGWLDSEHPFPTYGTDQAEEVGITSEFLRRLFAVCCQPTRQSRGVVRCPLCQNGPILVHHDGRTRMLGSAEMEIRDTNGISYRAPDLIFHCVTVHRYLPPDPFRLAILHPLLP